MRRYSIPRNDLTQRGQACAVYSIYGAEGGSNALVQMRDMDRIWKDVYESQCDVAGCQCGGRREVHIKHQELSKSPESKTRWMIQWGKIVIWSLIWLISKREANVNPEALSARRLKMPQSTRSLHGSIGSASSRNPDLSKRSPFQSSVFQDFQLLQVINGLLLVCCSQAKGFFGGGARMFVARAAIRRQLINGRSSC